MLKTILSREVGLWKRSVAQGAAGRGGPDAVHQLRVRSRRCREALRLIGYKSRALSRFNHSLGPTRDVEMLCERLAADRHLSPEQHRLWRLLSRRRRLMTRRLAQRLRSPSVRRLGISLGERMRKTSLNSSTEDELIRDALLRSYRHLHRLWKQRPEGPQKTYLHRLRRAIRRLRYTGEILVPVRGVHCQRLAAQAIRWQRLLGRYQDSLIAQRLLKKFRGRENRALLRDLKSFEKGTAKRFWTKWCRRGWHRLQRQTRKAIRAVG